MSTAIGCTTRIFAAGALVLVLGTTTAHALALDPDQSKCRQTIAKEATKFVAGLLKVHQKCRDANLKEVGGCPLTDPAAIAALETKLRVGLAKKCNLGVARLASLGFPGPCADANPGNGFTLVDLQDCIETAHERAIAGACVGGLNSGEACTTLADCPDAGVGTACRSILAIEYDPDTTALAPLPPATLACQKELAHSAGKFLITVLKTLQAARNGIDKGCATDEAKRQAKIAKARTKAQAKIASKCTDAMVTTLAACEPDQTTVADTCTGGTNGGQPCSQLSDCPDSSPGTSCSGAASCLTSTHETPAGDAVPTAPPDLIDVEYQCATPASWPATVEITASGIGTDLDIGWTGISHDQAIPANGRLTLAVSGCGSTSFPCGACSLSGPIDNAGGAAFDNHRCADKTWLPCSTDTDCTNGGALGPCAYFFGAPLPLSAGGYPACVVNQIEGGVTGTLNLDAGTASATTPLLSRVYTDGTIARPCPRCSGNVCLEGARAGQPCVVQGTGIFGGVSLDCPPDPGGHSGDLHIDLAIATGNQTVTLSAGNPNCRANGYTATKCFCDTCNNAGADACMSNADCPPSGGNPGVCGGKRCVGGANAGAPCTSPSACPGGLCDRPGEPTQPNACVDDSSEPDDGTLCVDAPPFDDDEGQCPEGPIDRFCSSEHFRSCISDGDCACVGCALGQTCVNQLRPCFLDNGVVGSGDGVSVAGTVDPPCDGLARPVLGALFCVGPTGSASINTAAGLPGLGRLRLPVETVLQP